MPDTCYRKEFFHLQFSDSASFLSSSSPLHFCVRLVPLFSCFISFRYPRCSVFSTPSAPPLSLFPPLFLFPGSSNVCRWVDRYLGREFWQCDPPTLASFLHQPLDEMRRRAASITVSCRIQFLIYACMYTYIILHVLLFLFTIEWIVIEVINLSTANFSIASDSDKLEINRENDSTKY